MGQVPEIKWMMMMMIYDVVVSTVDNSKNTLRRRWHRTSTLDVQ